MACEGGVAALTARLLRRARPRVLVYLGLGYLLFLGYPIAWLVQAKLGPLARILTLAGLSVFVLLYVWLMSSVTIDAPPRRVSKLAVLAALVALASLSVALSLAGGDTWIRLFIYVAVASAFALPPLAGLLVVVAIGGLTVATAMTVGGGWSNALQAAILVLAVGVGMVGTSWLVATIRELQAARAEIARLAASEERLRLARDLHDSVKQQVFAAAMQIAAARRLLPSDTAGAITHLDLAQTLVHEAQKELASIIHPVATGDEPALRLAEALRDHALRWSRQSGIGAEVAIQDDCYAPEEPAQVLFRVAQEALANVWRHSHARRARIELARAGDSLVLQVCDDGRGFAPSEAVGQGSGLRGMRERAEAVGGTLVIESIRGHGTRLTCACPLHARGGAAPQR